MKVLTSFYGCPIELKLENMKKYSVINPSGTREKLAVKDSEY